MNREKISRATKAILLLLSENKFTPDESTALLKCLEHVLQTQAIENDLVVASLKKIKAVSNGLAPLESILPK